MAAAAVCFDAARSTTAGNTERQTYTIRTGTDVSTVVLDITVLGAATFNGSAVVNSRWKSTTTFDTWLPRGDGVALKFQSTETNIANPSPATTAELVSAAINGRAVAP